MSSGKKGKARKSAARSWLVILGSVTLLAAAIGGGLVAVRIHRDREATRAREEGFAFYDEGKYREALGPLSLAVSRDRDRTDIEAMRRLAKARLMVPETNNAHIPAAMRFYRAAANADPQDLESRRQLLMLHARSGQLTEVDDVAKEIAAIDPNDPMAAGMSVEVLLARGETAAAEKFLADRVSTNPDDVEAKLRLVSIRIQSGRSPQETLEQVEAWMSAADADPLLRIARIQCLGRLGRNAELPAEIEILEATEPSTANGCRILSRGLLSSGRTQSGKRVLESGAARLGGAEGAELAGELFRVAWLEGDLATARRAIALGETSVDARWVPRARATLAFLERDAAALAEANRSLGPASGGTAADREFGVGLLAALEAKPNPNAAAVVVERTLTVNQRDPLLLAGLSMLREQSGDRAAAIASLSAAFEAAERRWVFAGVTLAPMLETYGDRKRAIEVIKELATRQPTSGPAQALLLLAAADAARRGEPPVIADRDLGEITDVAVAEARRNPGFLTVAFGGLVGTGREDEAIALALEAAGNGDVPPVILLELARNAIPIRNEAPGAEAAIDTLLARAAERGAQPMAIEAVRSLRVGRGEALAGIAELAEGDDPLALRNAASIADGRDPELAKRLMTRILDGDPDLETALFVLRSQTALADAAMLERAIAAVEKAEGGRGDSTTIARARLILGRENATRAEIDQALAAVDDLRRRKGDSVEALTVMANLLLGSDPPDRGSAARLAAQAAGLAPDRAQLQLFAATTARLAGNPTAARGFLDKARAAPGGSVRENPDLARAIAAELAESGEVGLAAAEFRALAEATKRSQDWSAAADLAGLANDAAGRERALRAAAAASDAAPESSIPLAFLLASTGRIAEADPIIARLETTLPEQVAVPLRIEYDLNFRPSESAVAGLDAALGRFPDNLTLKILKARERLGKGDENGAIEVLEGVLAGAPGSMQARDMALMLVGSAGPVGDRAVEALVRANAPSGPPLRELRAMRDGTAPASAAKARELARSIRGLWIGWGMALDIANAANDVSGLLQIAEDASNALPFDARAATARINVLLRTGRAAEAKDLAERLPRVPDADPRVASRLLALSHLGLGQIAKAQEIAMASFRATGDLDALLLAASIDAQTGNVGAGQAKVAGELPKSPLLMRAWVSRSLSLSDADARALLEANAAATGQAPLAFASAWAALALRGDRDAARKADEAFATADPQGTELERLAVAYEVALASEDQARIDAARAAFAAVLPESVRGVLDGSKAEGATRSLPTIFAAECAAAEARQSLDRARNLDRALALVEAALSANPDLRHRILRGRILLAKGEVADATAEAARLVQEAPADPEAWLLLARARMATRDFAAARAAVADGKQAFVTGFFVRPQVRADLDSVDAAAQALAPRG